MLVVNKDFNAHFITEAVTLAPGENTLTDEQYAGIKNNKWFIHLVTIGAVRETEKAIPSLEPDSVPTPSRKIRKEVTTPVEVEVNR